MLFLILFLTTIILIIYYKLIVPFFYWKRKKIPYETPWTRFLKVFMTSQPFTDTIKAAYNDHPDKRYYGSYQFLHPSLFVRDLDLIKRITVKDFDHFTDHLGFTSEKTDPILGLNLFSLKGTKWRQMRTTLTPAFTGSKMRAMFELIAETASDFTRHFEKQNGDVLEMEMKDVFSRYTNDVIAKCAFGLECNSLGDSHNEFYNMGKYVSTPTTWRLIKTILYGFFPKVFEFFQIPALPTYISDFFLRTVKDAIASREMEGVIRPDMIHLLLEARKGRLKSDEDDTTTERDDKSPLYTDAIEMTDEMITAQALVFFIAGFTTASTIMSFMSYHLALNPQIQGQLREEIAATLEKSQGRMRYDDLLKMRLLDQVVSETLRMYPPGFVLNRVCTKDFVIEPETPDETRCCIEKGCLVAIPAIAIHYCADFYPNPETFDPERFSEENRAAIVPGSYMPFGLGPRNCIGSRFALLEIKALLVCFLDKFEIVPIAKTAIPLKMAKTLSLEAKGGIWLGFKKRK